METAKSAFSETRAHCQCNTTLAGIGSHLGRYCKPGWGTVHGTKTLLKISWSLLAREAILIKVSLKSEGPNSCVLPWDALPCAANHKGHLDGTCRAFFPFCLPNNIEAQRILE
jgi:hypothetical protein